jgi:hypothetical protein
VPGYAISKRRFVPPEKGLTADPRRSHGFTMFRTSLILAFNWEQARGLCGLIVDAVGERGVPLAGRRLSAGVLSNLLIRSGSPATGSPGSRNGKAEADKIAATALSGKPRRNRHCNEVPPG